MDLAEGNVSVGFLADSFAYSRGLRASSGCPRLVFLFIIWRRNVFIVGNTGPFLDLHWLAIHFLFEEEWCFIWLGVKFRIYFFHFMLGKFSWCIADIIVCHIYKHFALSFCMILLSGDFTLYIVHQHLAYRITCIVRLLDSAFSYRHEMRVIVTIIVSLRLSLSHWLPGLNLLVRLSLLRLWLAHNPKVVYWFRRHRLCFVSIFLFSKWRDERWILVVPPFTWLLCRLRVWGQLNHSWLSFCFLQLALSLTLVQINQFFILQNCLKLISEVK